MFPSPSNGNFNIYLNNISAEKLYIDMYDLNGKKVTQVYNVMLMPNYIPKAPLNPDNYRDAGRLVPFFWTIIY
ncbi:MAG: T9SS type A sorting domain-containing protein [Bacteroidota bacterium]|nr:T9SS type A sorting domain-containing protein [Bacteroidota bacterium]